MHINHSNFDIYNQFMNIHIRIMDTHTCIMGQIVEDAI